MVPWIYQQVKNQFIVTPSGVEGQNQQQTIVTPSGVEGQNQQQTIVTPSERGPALSGAEASMGKYQ
jgi:hypothetical protein